MHSSWLRRPARRPRRRPPWRRLWFTPYAWAKWQHLGARASTNLSAFGVSADGRPLLIEDVLLFQQTCTRRNVEFDQAALADYLHRQEARGLTFDRCGRVWLQTHPAPPAAPSELEERTFAQLFARVDWGVLAILARDGSSYARLRFNAGPGGELPLGVGLDCQGEFLAPDRHAWSEEFDRYVIDQQRQQSLVDGSANGRHSPAVASAIEISVDRLAPRTGPRPPETPGEG